eukprot:31823-Rhodomonas_salina.2
MFSICDAGSRFVSRQTVPPFQSSGSRAPASMALTPAKMMRCIAIGASRTSSYVTLSVPPALRSGS